MSVAEHVEKRAAPRSRVVLGGKLVYGGHAFTPECVIRNLTDGGASVRISEELTPAPTLSLIESSTGRAHEARVVWRRNGFAGLAFTSTRDLNAAAPTDPLRRLWTDALPRGR